MRYPAGLFEDGPAHAISYYDTILPEARRQGDPLLIIVAEGSLFYALHYAGERDRVRGLIDQWIDDSEAAGGLVISGCLNAVAAVLVLDGEASAAVAPLARALPIALSEGVTRDVLDGALVAAALAVKQLRLPQAERLLAGVSQHAGPLGYSSYTLFHDCRQAAEQAIRDSGRSVEEAQMRHRPVTLDELVASGKTPGPDVSSPTLPADASLSHLE
jgi:hypothetical protein